MFTQRSPLQAHVEAKPGSPESSGTQSSCSTNVSSQAASGPGSPPSSLPATAQHSNELSASSHHEYPASQTHEFSPINKLCDPASPHPSRKSPSSFASPPTHPTKTSAPQTIPDSTRRIHDSLPHNQPKTDTHHPARTCPELSRKPRPNIHPSRSTTPQTPPPSEANVEPPSGGHSYQCEQLADPTREPRDRPDAKRPPLAECQAAAGG
jgi:hypothetical protein